MRRLTIGQRNDDFFKESFYYTLLFIHIFIYVSFVLLHVHIFNVFLSHSHTYKMCFHLLSSMFTSFYGTPRPMGANNVSGCLISPRIISYILLKNITVLSLSFIICINVHRKTEMLIKSNYLDNI